MIIIQPGVPLVEIERSHVVESVHTGHLIVLAPDGSTRLSLGNPGQPIFPRSSMKPLQAVGLLRTGVDFEPTDLALATSSHSGSQLHRDLIAAELGAAGLSDGDLECPPDLPLGVAEQRSYLAAGLAETRLAMNCSGKHTAMLRACLANGWQLSGYLSPSHPLQLELKAAVEDLTGEAAAIVVLMILISAPMIDL